MKSERVGVFEDAGDLCLGFWKQVYDAGHVPIPPGARVLEIGCAEGDWMTPMKQARPDLHLTGIDWRSCACPGADVLLQGDVLTAALAPASFDLVVLISALEHIGLGGYNDAPIDDWGDTHTMERIHGWLKPGGLCYCDVPYRAEGPFTVNYHWRIYSADTLARIVTAGFVERYAEDIPSTHPDGPYRAMVLQKV